MRRCCTPRRARRWCASSAPAAGAFPDYDRAVLLRELMLFPSGTSNAYKGVTLGRSMARRTLTDAFELLIANNLAQPQVFNHIRNPPHAQPDAAAGSKRIRARARRRMRCSTRSPTTWSRCCGAYVAWDEEQVLDWAIRHWERARKASLPVAADFSRVLPRFRMDGAATPPEGAGHLRAPEPPRRQEPLSPTCRACCAT